MEFVFEDLDPTPYHQSTASISNPAENWRCCWARYRSTKRDGGSMCGTSLAGTCENVLSMFMIWHFTVVTRGMAHWHIGTSASMHCNRKTRPNTANVSAKYQLFWLVNGHFHQRSKEMKHKVFLAWNLRSNMWEEGESLKIFTSMRRLQCCAHCTRSRHTKEEGSQNAATDCKRRKKRH